MDYHLLLRAFAFGRPHYVSGPPLSSMRLHPAAKSFARAALFVAAVHAAAEYLVTGDQRDFGPLFGRTLRGVKVITLAQALDLALRRAGT